MPHRNYVIVNSEEAREKLAEYVNTKNIPTIRGYLYVNPAAKIVIWETSAHKHPAIHSDIDAVCKVLEYTHTPYKPTAAQGTGAQKTPVPSALDKQTGGNHYKKLKIQPAEYAEANSLSSLEGKVVKYVTRHEDKGGVQDLRKAIHCLELLIEFIENGTRAYTGAK